MSKSNIVSTLGSQDFQALGLSFDMSLSFEEAFLIPYYHTVPLSIEITLLKNQKHYIQFHRKMLHGLLVHLKMLKTKKLPNNVLGH